jgi:hypothetical protein
LRWRLSLLMFLLYAPSGALVPMFAVAAGISCTLVVVFAHGFRPGAEAAPEEVLLLREDAESAPI